MKVLAPIAVKVSKREFNYYRKELVEAGYKVEIVESKGHDGATNVTIFIKDHVIARKVGDVHVVYPACFAEGIQEGE